MIVILNYFESFLLVAPLPQTVDNHIVGARPDAALPVAALFVVFRVVGAYRRHHARAFELLRIVQVLHESLNLCIAENIALKCPECAYALGAA